MAELERELCAVRVEWPDEPKLAGRVTARLSEARPRPSFGRRALVVALAALVVAVAASFAVPSARTAILRWLGLHHVRVVRVAELPTTRKLAIADFGTRMSLAEARPRLHFEPLRLPEPADSIFLLSGPGGARITFVYGDVRHPRLTLSEFQGFGVTKYVEKLVGSGTHLERVEVNGDPGLWLSGEPHAVYFENPNVPQNVFLEQPLLAGNTLVWERRDDLTVRLEGDLSKSDALRLAQSLR